MKRQGLCQDSNRGTQNQARGPSECATVSGHVGQRSTKPAPGRRECQARLTRAAQRPECAHFSRPLNESKAQQGCCGRWPVLLRRQGSRTPFSASFPGAHPSTISTCFQTYRFKSVQFLSSAAPESLITWPRAFQKLQAQRSMQGRHLTHLPFSPLHSETKWMSSNYIIKIFTIFYN